MTLNTWLQGLLLAAVGPTLAIALGGCTPTRTPLPGAVATQNAVASENPPEHVRLVPVSIGGHVWDWKPADTPCRLPNPATATGVWLSPVNLELYGETDGVAGKDCGDAQHLPPDDADHCEDITTTGVVGGYQFQWLYAGEGTPIEYTVTVVGGQALSGKSFWCDTDDPTGGSSTTPTVSITVEVPPFSTSWVNHDANFAYK